MRAIFCVSHLAFRILPSFYIVHVVAETSVLVDVLFVVLIAYAILKYQLFDIEVKTKRGIRYFIVMTTFAGSLIILSEGMEFFLVESLFSGPVFSIAVFSLIFFKKGDFAQRPECI